MMSAWRMLLLSMAFLGVVGMAVWAVVAHRPVEDKKGGVGYKRLSGTVAEGFAYRVGSEKYPRVTCSACRVGKMKLGLISLGAFNAIEFDDLVINVPEASPCPAVEAGCSETPKGKSDADVVVNAFSLKSVMSMACVEAKAFAGIRISRLRVNKMVGDSLVPILSAESLKSAGRRLVLHNAVLHMEGQTQKAAEVELKVNPRFRLVWPTGSWDLTDVLAPIL